MSELEKRVRERFGVLPNFFLLAAEAPEITEKLWGFAQAAYLDNPLPSGVKERLFVHLSRFCAVRYCLARRPRLLVGPQCRGAAVARPGADTQRGDGILSRAGHVGCQTADAPECLDALERL